MAVEVRKRTLYQKLILRKRRRKFLYEFDVVRTLSHGLSIVAYSMSFLLVFNIFVQCGSSTQCHSKAGGPNLY